MEPILTHILFKEFNNFLDFILISSTRLHMKKLFILICLLLTFNIGFSQNNNIQLQFSGKDLETGYAVALETVQIINQTKSVDTLLTGGNFVFEIVQSQGINDPQQTQKNFRLHQVAPNPFSGSTKLVVEVFNPLQFDLQLYNSSGITVAQARQTLISGMHIFSVSIARQGIYVLRVSDGESSGSVKLLAQSHASAAEAVITYSSGSDLPFKEQEEMNTGGFTFTLGDQLQFIGFAEGFANSTLYDSPDSDTAYIFNFSKPFYRIEGHALQTSQPCFVDVLFSVVDEEYRGVDNLSNNDFRILENNSAVSPTETFRYIRKSNTVPYKLKTVILLDNSASVADKLEQIKSAAVSLVNTITDKQEFAIYSFSDIAVLVQDFTNDVELLSDAINSITTGFPSTNLYGAYITAVNKWNNSFSTELIEQGFLVVFTDGDDTQGSFTLQEALSARGNKKAYMIGLGNELNPDPLNQLANPGPYFSIANIEELEQTFLEIQDDMIRYANSFYWLNYMTPKRQGLHTLKLEIIGNENSFSDSYYEEQFNANGFSSVLSGVYLNTNPGILYGIDSLTIQNQTPYELRAVTYWAYGPPEYAWSSSNNNIVTLTTDPLYFNKAVMNFPGIEGGVAFVTVTDETNLYEKTLKITAYTPPVVTTAPVTDISYTTATSGGNVTGDGGLPVTQRGVCWSLNQNPTINSSHTSDSIGTGPFISNITGLQANKTYYLRAYAKNDKDVSYGEQFSFTTVMAGAPLVTTLAAGNLTETGAVLNGEVISQGNFPVSIRGFCYGTEPNPDFTNDTIQAGSGIGIFNAQINNLLSQTTYYVRAFATNSINTTYGNEVSIFTMNYTPATVTTSSITGIGCDNAIGGGNVTSQGNSPVTARGICWSTSPNPTINDTLTVDGSGTGGFTSQMTNLLPQTTYYVRAYATNTSGTSYGVQKTLTTEECTPATVITSDITNITSGTATGGGNVTNGGNSTVTVRGVCWSTSQNPTTNDAHSIETGGIGSFTSAITGLIELTTYFVRAYATNGGGTSYGNEVTFSTLAWICGDPLFDERDGQSYATVQIGNQCWMAENLNIGIMIQSSMNMSNNGVIEKYCYDNSQTNCNVYGGLYQWNEMMEYSITPGIQGICPTDWHIPTDAEWTTLTNYLGGESAAGGKMKETGFEHWAPPNLGATNSSGFTGLPGGCRNPSGYFNSQYIDGYWWSSSRYGSSNTWFRYLSCYYSYVTRDRWDHSYGFSIRCLKD